MKALFLLLLLSLAWSCSDQEIIVPSVVKGKGELIRIKMVAESGSPEVFLKLDPIYGETVQQSMMKAYKYAYTFADPTTPCKIKVYILTEGTVDGPSAGAAFALGFYSVLSDLELPKRYVITGTINDGASIGPVGGIFEKATAAKEAGLPFITGKLSLEEKLVLNEMGIKFVEVSNFSDLLDVVINNKTTDESFPHLNISIKSIPYEKDEFLEIAMFLIEQEEMFVDELSSAEMRNYFKEEIERQKELLSKGYVLPVANEAFRGASILYATKNINKDREDIRQGVEGCLSSIKKYPLTEDNFEVNAFAIARIYRTLRILEELPEVEEDRINERIGMGNAYMWCLTAKRLLSEGTGAPIDESKVEVRIDGISDNFHSAVISDLLRDGHNVSAYYEVAYAKSNATVSSSNTEFNSKIGKLYYSYSVYALEKGNLEEALLWLENANSAEKFYNEIQLKNKDDLSLFALILFSIFIVAWLFVFTLSFLSK